MAKIDLNQLTWFQVVAEERSFTKAAAKLGVAQSTLSHTIKQLEERMGLRLLTRTTRNVATTAAGGRLLQTITPRLTEIEEEIAALTALREKPSGSIRLTLSDHALESVVWTGAPRPGERSAHLQQFLRHDRCRGERLRHRLCP